MSLERRIPPYAELGDARELDFVGVLAGIHELVGEEVSVEIAGPAGDDVAPSRDRRPIAPGRRSLVCPGRVARRRGRDERVCTVGADTWTSREGMNQNREGGHRPRGGR